jgi:hypothetical protein
MKKTFLIVLILSKLSFNSRKYKKTGLTWPFHPS